MITILMLLVGFSAQALVPVQDIIDPGAIDRKVDPCDDFYQFACGAWQKSFKLPSDKSRYWRQANVLVDNVEETLNKILADLPKHGVNAASPVKDKLGAFYHSCRMVSTPDTRGMKELKSRLKKLDAIATRAQFSQRLAEQSLNGSGGFFELYNSQDPKNSNIEIAFVDRGGMSLPDPDYYLKDDAKSKEVRVRYVEQVSKVMQIVGMNADDADQMASNMLAFETNLAKSALSKDERRDMEKLFHPTKLSELEKLVPVVDWKIYFKTLGIKAPTSVNVVEPEFMKKMNEWVENMTPADRAGFLKFKLVHRSGYFIPGPLQQEEFAFWRAYLNGQKEMPPQWKYCTQVVAGNMGEALGQAYLASIPGAKDIRSKTETMFTDIKEAFAKQLDKVSWMDASTRAAAHKKLDKLGSKIGWPDKWRNYARLQIRSDAFYVNELAATEFEIRRGLDKIGKPTDRSEWYMSIWEPNAYYSDSNNEMVLPLGELVPPVFDPRFSEGANYGALGGSTIGHELIHGFDDAGKDMDADGNYVTWWSEDAKKNFAKQSMCYIEQTEAFDIVPGSKLRIRGKATLGENLADNAGVMLGLVALKKRMQTRKPAEKVDGLNELQQFFVGYAQGWCTKMTDEQMREQLLTDFHPPSEFRVNMVLANHAEFAEAFSCKSGSKMAPKKRCSLW